MGFFDLIADWFTIGMMIQFNIITIFPKIFDSYFKESILKRAQKEGLIKIAVHNLRDFAAGKHKKVDDKPYGGGPGMVFMIEPIYKAVEFAKRKARSAMPTGRQAKRKKVILFSTRGKKFDAKVAKRLALCDQLILICGRYEGVDERVAEHITDEEISIGDYVLSGGELAAMVLVEAVARFIPGVLGKRESLEEIKGSYPVYTRPENFILKGKSQSAKRKAQKGWQVPKVLVSGNHKKIDKWRSSR